MKRATLEICAGDIASVHAAEAGGADRVELCSGLELGGLTPSAGLIREARKVEGLAVNVLIRPREGDFIYSAEETECMIRDVTAAVELGVDGVVVGALTVEGKIDKELCRRLIRAAGNKNITFHRAFDMVVDPFEALEDIIELGCDRILTSGQAASAEEGIPLLAELKKKAANRISIMAGGGVTPENVGRILKAKAADEVHASAKSLVVSESRYRPAGISMGSPAMDEFSRMSTNAVIVKNLMQQIQIIDINQ